MRPYGYLSDDSVVEHEAVVLRAVKHKLLVDRIKLGPCIADLRQRKVTTVTGGQWTETNMRRTLTNPRLAGLKRERGKLVKAPWDGIFTPDEHFELVALLDDPSRKTGPKSSSEPKYLLSGERLRCGRDVEDEGGTHTCGKRLYIQSGNAVSRAYTCTPKGPSYGCGRLRIKAEPLEEEVAVRVLARLASPAVRKRLAAALGAAAGGKEGVDDAIEAIEGRVNEAAREYATRQIGMATLKTIERQAAGDIKQLRDQLEQKRRLDELPATTADGLAEWWTDAPMRSKRDLVALVLDHVIVKPATRRGRQGLDPDRLEFVWK